jgi:hypothetical protein
MKSGALATGVEAQTHPKPAEISHKHGRTLRIDSVLRFGDPNNRARGFEMNLPGSRDVERRETAL